MRGVLQLAGLVVVLGGCGDNLPAPPPALGQLDGLWLIGSLTQPGEDGTPVTATRDGASHQIRGDVEIRATGGTQGVWDLRRVTIEDGAVVAIPPEVVQTAALDGDRLVLTDEGGSVVVYTLDAGDDQLTLRRDDTDPRGTAASPPTTIVLDRAPPWSTALVGTSDVVSLENTDGTHLTDACDGGSTRLSMSWTLSPRMMLERDWELVYYVDSFCPPNPQPVPPCTCRVEDIVGHERAYAEHDPDRATLRVWTVEGVSHVGDWSAQVFDVQIGAALTTLTLASCEPQPECGGGRWFGANLREVTLRPPH